VARSALWIQELSETCFLPHPARFEQPHF